MNMAAARKQDTCMATEVPEQHAAISSHVASVMPCAHTLEIPRCPLHKGRVDCNTDTNMRALGAVSCGLTSNMLFLKHEECMARGIC